MNESIAITPTTPKPRKRPMNPQAGAQGLINLALIVWMIWDLRHRSDEGINGKRKLWLLAAFAPPIGPIAYFIFGRKRHAQATEIPLETTDTP
jgi:hypothetical protein